jgi:hypothetical protein
VFRQEGFEVIAGNCNLFPHDGGGEIPSARSKDFSTARFDMAFARVSDPLSSFPSSFARDSKPPSVLKIAYTGMPIEVRIACASAAVHAVA